MSEPEDSEEEEPDIVIKAEEDEDSSSEESSGARPVGGEPMDSKRFGLFAVLVVAAAALAAGGITLGVWLYRRNQEDD